MANKKSAIHVELGIPGAAQFQADLEELVTASEHTPDSAPFSLTITDLDKLAAINEKHGSFIGDELVSETCTAFRKALPKSAKIYRYAGDCFAVLFPDTDKEQAFLLMERIREQIYAMEFTHKDLKARNLKLTISTGVACYPDDGPRCADMIRRVEGALFRAKIGGANRVCLSREDKLMPKTSHYTAEQLQRLSAISKKLGLGEAMLLREALDDLLKKYSE